MALPDPTLFVDLLQALKESALTSFDSIIAEREEIVRRNEAYMQSPPGEESWNFRKYFLIKVSSFPALLRVISERAEPCLSVRNRV